MIDDPTRLPDDLEDISRAIPPASRGLGFLRQLFALLPPPLGATTQGSFPADELVPPESAGEQLGTQPGSGSLGAGALQPGAVSTGSIRDKAISNLALFAQTIRPVAIVASLPALPDPLYPVGSTVVLTTNGVLYRNHGGAWTANVLAIGGGIEAVAALPSLPSAAYPEGSVVFLTTDDKLYRSTGTAWVRATDGADITAGTITGDRMVAGTITAAQIGVGAIEADELAANSVVAGKVAAGAISTTELAANAVTTDKLAARSVYIGQLADDPGGNLVTNPGFEADGAVVTDGAARGWAVSIGTATNFDTLSGGSATRGSYVFRLTGVNGAVQQLLSNPFSVEPGATYELGAWMRGAAGNSANAQGRVVIYWFDAAAVQISASELVQYIMGANAVLTYKAGTIVAPLTAVTGKIGVRTTSTVTTGDEAFFDDVFMYRVDRNLEHAAGDVLIDSAGITVTGGKITVENAGATVIIDGTSNMFKIAATGTGSVSLTANTYDTTVIEVTLSGLGTQTVAPAHMVFSSDASSNAFPKKGPGFTYIGAYTSPGVFVAASSGGSPTVRTTGLATIAQWQTDINGSSIVEIQCHYWNAHSSAVTVWYRYYVLLEAAM